MATVNLGKVGMTLKGVYDNEVQYEKLDVVYYEDSTYCAKSSTIGNLPTDEQYWQLLVAPNPLTTWKPNTKEDEGYVEKGEGNEDKVWATDSEGNPAWREYSSDPAAIIDTNNWNSQDFGKIRLVAEVTVSPYEGSSTYQRVDFSSFCSKGDSVPVKGIIVGGLNRESGGSDIAYLYRYSIGGMYSNWGILYKSQTNQAEPAKFYLCTAYSGSTKITIYDFHKTEGITNVEWIFDQNKYLDTTQLEREDYEYYGYSYQLSEMAYYPQPVVSSSQSGIVPAPKGGYPYYEALTNNIFSTDSKGYPEWQTPSALNLPTNTEVDTKIAEAITAANVPEFVERETVPSVEEAEKNKFYLVKNEDTGHYDIYALLGDNVELIDDTTVDLTNYTTLTDEQYNALIALLGEE